MHADKKMHIEIQLSGAGRRWQLQSNWLSWGEHQLCPDCGNMTVGDRILHLTRSCHREKSCCEKGKSQGDGAALPAAFKSASISVPKSKWFKSDF